VTREECNAFCGGLPATTHVVQWGGSDVWKVGGKVFDICNGNDDALPGISFKTSEIAFEALRDMPGLRPAPYLASRGMKWIQRFAEPGLASSDLRDCLRDSHRLVAAGLTRKARRELGLESG
jgi:predicted DNA-binding protein (MmcQ/YjbR family)